MKPYIEYLEIASQAVYMACGLCEEIRKNRAFFAKRKKDTSPVTLADLLSQALIGAYLRKHFPYIPLIAEEDVSDFEMDWPKLREQYPELQKFRLSELLQSTKQIKHSAKEENGFWVLDPIDGTKGFLQNRQYAIALAYVRKGKVLVGVLGCPNLQLEGKRGWIFRALQGQGSFAASLEERLSFSPISTSLATKTSEARYCESWESAHSCQALSHKIAQKLGMKKVIRMDSQCKYGLLAKGEAEVYLRFPLNRNYRENIWDHAAGYVILREAGGKVSDARGKDLDFSHGKTLAANYGIVATGGQIHHEVLKAVREVLD